MGSCIELSSQTQPYTVSITGSTFSYCFGANQGGALSFQSASSVVNVALTSNTFSGNMAVSGGSFFCKECDITTLVNNKFSGDFANNGGNIYLHNLVNDMTVAPLFFDGHSHSTSVAATSGGAIYYTEDAPTAPAVKSVSLQFGMQNALSTIS